jgi:hypothetical protein
MCCMSKKDRLVACPWSFLIVRGLFGAAVLFCVFAGCESSVGMVTSEDVDHAYVGRVILGEPARRGDEVRIPLRFEGGAWMDNSGRVLRDVEACSSGNEIDFAVRTCLARGAADAVDPAIAVDGLAAGRYELFYRNPDGTRHSVGFVDVP